MYLSNLLLLFIKTLTNYFKIVNQTAGRNILKFTLFLPKVSELTFALREVAVIGKTGK